jgi:YggT family protein
MLTILNIIAVLLTVLRWVIIAQIVMSLLISFNVINTYNDFVASLWKALNALTEPLYRPIRRILPDTGSIDFAPAVILILLFILSDIILPAVAQSLIAAPVA